MAASKVGILVEQGARFTRLLTFQDVDHVPVDVTGWTFAGKIRETQSSATSLASFTFTILDQVTNTGQVEMTMTGAVTAGIAEAFSDTYERIPSFFLYDVEVTRGGDVDRILEGTVEFSPEVTKSG